MHKDIVAWATGTTASCNCVGVVMYTVVTRYVILSSVCDVICICSIQGILNSLLRNMVKAIFELLRTVQAKVAAETRLHRVAF